MGSPSRPGDRAHVTRAAASTLVIAAAVATGLGGCGGDDDKSPDRAGQATTTESATAPTAAGRPQPQKQKLSPKERRDTREIRQTARQLYGAVGRKDGRSMCGLMTKSDRDATARYTTSRTCEEGAKKLMIRSKARGVPTIVGVNVAGGRATATVRFGDGPVTAVPMAREDGEWKIAGNTPAKPKKKGD